MSARSKSRRRLSIRIPLGGGRLDLEVGGGPRLLDVSYDSGAERSEWGAWLGGAVSLPTAGRLRRRLL